MSVQTELVLGIETSCDDTSVGVVDRTGVIRGWATVSQVDIHNLYGGVWPELASRAHIDKILPAVELAMQRADVEPGDLRAIGVTRGPGLIGSLMVGTDTARGLGHGWNLPVLGVNHLRGHLRSADLEEQRVEYPAVVLLVSGGHTLLAHVMSPREIKLLGSTRDDSVGEAYDKVARMLGLGYPGGPPVDRMAATGDARIDLPLPMRAGIEFSYSGLKEAVAKLFRAGEVGDGRRYSDADLAASFVRVCMKDLLGKSRRAIEMCRPASFVVVGGVAASPPLRAGAAELCADLGVKLCLPPLKWSTDNGPMIAMATWDYLDADMRIPARPTASLALESF